MAFVPGMLRAIGWTMAGLVLVMASPSWANGFDANRYLAPPLADDGLTMARPTTLASGTWGAALALSHADDALIAREVGGHERVLIEEQLWLYAFAAHGVTDWLTLHATLPIPIRQVGDTSGVEGVGARLHSFALGDLQFGGRVGLAPTRDQPLGLAFDGALLIPTGSREAFASDGQVRVQVTAIGELHPDQHVFVGATAGVLTRPELHVAGTTTNTLLQLALSGGFRTEADAVRLGLEGNAQIPFEHAGSSYELLGMVGVKVFRGLHAAIGAGPGIGSGKQTPDFRAVARIGWQLSP